MQHGPAPPASHRAPTCDTNAASSPVRGADSVPSRRLRLSGASAPAGSRRAAQKSSGRDQKAAQQLWTHPAMAHPAAHSVAQRPSG